MDPVTSIVEWLRSYLVSVGFGSRLCENEIEPAAKVAYRAFGKNYFGVEYYLEAGPIQRWLPNSQRSEVLYLAWDGKLGKADINVGLGRGFTDASDRWVLKTVFEFSF